jgi:hypothetical protein
VSRIRDVSVQEIVAQRETRQGIMGRGFEAARFFPRKPLIWQREKIRLARLRVRVELHQIRWECMPTRLSLWEGMT